MRCKVDHAILRESPCSRNKLTTGAKVNDLVSLARRYNRKNRVRFAQTENQARDATVLECALYTIRHSRRGTIGAIAATRRGICQTHIQGRSEEHTSELQSRGLIS